MSDNKFFLGRVLQNINRLKSDLPRVLANQAQNFFVQSWNKQGWDDGGVKPWAEVERRKPGTPEYKYPKNKGLSRRTRAILVESGKTRRAVSDSIRQVSFERTLLTVAVPYAVYLNDGTEKMPQRKYMGDSKTLRVMQVKTITTYIDRIWQ